MAISVGARFGAYEVAALIGVGGMGEVYRATDPSLKRSVALKVLSESLAGDANRLARLQREAEMLAALSHGNIAHIYGLERSEGTTALVMEFVEGPTLAERIAQGRIPVEEALRIATQIADALEAAHERGIVHRDLKPANIKLRPDGTVKVLDFGVAKALDARTTGSGPAALTTPAMTEAGFVLGTAAYMSPEQARGKPVDERTDIWAFGCVLYEMLTGQPAFLGEDVTSTLARVLEARADLSALPSDVSTSVRRTLELCFEKDARKRIADIRDVRLALTGAFAPGTPVQPLWRRALPMAATVVVVALLLGVGTWSLKRVSPSQPAQAQEMRFAIPVPGYQLGGLSISPDGQRITYASTASGSRQIWIRPIDALEAHVLPGADNGEGIFWSPDSRYLAFSSSDGKLKRMDADGGPAQAIADVPPSDLGGSWSRSGKIIYSLPNAADIVLVTADGRVTPWPEHRPPSVVFRTLARLLPDGDHFVYVNISPSGPNGGVFVGSLAKTKSTLVASPPAGGRGGPPPSTMTQGLAYADGYVLYHVTGDAALMAVPFDADALEIRGDAQLAAANVAEFAVAGNVLVYRDQTPTKDVGGTQLTWVNRRGERMGRVEAPTGYVLPVLSPDGRRIALSAPDADSLGHIWTIDTDRGTPARLTFGKGLDLAPVWSPDGTEVVFTSGPTGIFNSLYRRAANGTGKAEPLFAGENDELLTPLAWSPDGRFLVFGRSQVSTFRQQGDLWTLELTGERQARALVSSPGRKGPARLSPDGRWIAYATNESNTEQIVVQPFPNVGQGKWQISGFGTEPKWRADGRELYYLAPNGDLMAVDVDTTGEVFASGTPHVLFATGITPPPEARPDYYYDVTPDGQKFLLNEPTPAASSTAAQNGVPAAPELPLNVIVNWSSGLRRQ